MKVIFGVDIGGTNIKIGKFFNDEEKEVQEIPTNLTDNGKYIITDIIATIKEMLCNDEIIGIGLGVPGPVVDNILLASHNLKWGRTDLVSKLNQEFPNALIKVINDANAATIGEQHYGGGMSFNDFVLVTLGTGIGGGLIMDGQLREGITGSSGEIGHIRVDFRNLRKCNCGLFDCVERYASATGIVHTARELITNRQTILTNDNLTSKAIFNAAKEGDIFALEVVDLMVEKLATALSQVANTINPEGFVIGGGVSKAGQFLIDKLQKRFSELAFFSVKNTKFTLAKLGNDAGIYGSYHIIKEASNNENN